jgi:hypothetical protein
VESPHPEPEVDVTEGEPVVEEPQVVVAGDLAVDPGLHTRERWLWLNQQQISRL